MRAEYPEAVLFGISRVVPSWGGVDEREQILAPSGKLRRAGLTDAAFRRRNVAELGKHKDAIGELIESWERRGREFGIEVMEVAT